MGTTPRAIIIFVVFVVGLSMIGKVSKALSGNAGDGVAGMILVGGVSILLYVLNKAWEARKNKA